MFAVFTIKIPLDQSNKCKNSQIPVAVAVSCASTVATPGAASSQQQPLSARGASRFAASIDPKGWRRAGGGPGGRGIQLNGHGLPTSHVSFRAH